MNTTGVLSSPGRDEAGYRQYDRQALARVVFTDYKIATYGGDCTP
jgi:DNA-binding transcriptional MerR regulator